MLFGEASDVCFNLRIYDQVFVLTSQNTRSGGEGGCKMYVTCDTPHHALQTKYPLHDSKPGLVTSTAELINPSRERQTERKKTSVRGFEITVTCVLHVTVQW